MDAMKRWLGGIPYEVAFWESYYASLRRRRDLCRWSGYGRECVLDNFDVSSFAAGCREGRPRILDVGCALSYAMGTMIGGREADVVYVDPLAPSYNDILRRYRVERPAITPGMIESLSATFAPGEADLIHVRNALDHCADPFEGVIQSPPRAARRRC